MWNHDITQTSWNYQLSIFHFTQKFRVNGIRYQCYCSENNRARLSSPLAGEDEGEGKYPLSESSLRHPDLPPSRGRKSCACIFILHGAPLATASRRRRQAHGRLHKYITEVNGQPVIFRWRYGLEWISLTWRHNHNVAILLWNHYTAGAWCHEAPAHRFY